MVTLKKDMEQEFVRHCIHSIQCMIWQQPVYTA